MREVVISTALWIKIEEIRDYLIFNLRLSEIDAEDRINRMEEFVASLSKPVDYALCRFKRWRALGYRCVVFEGWVFAYEIVDGGIIVRDMAHGATLIE